MEQQNQPHEPSSQNSSVQKVLNDLHLSSEDRYKLLEIVEAEIQGTRLLRYKPYPKQKLFHNLGARYRERALFANNQGGKTYPATAEEAIHATGLYPDWWEGKVFEQPTESVVASTDGKTVRDVAQKYLLGLPGNYGTGWIPKELIHDIKTARGTPDLIDYVVVRHTLTDKLSFIYFKTYEQGRVNWQARTLHRILFDEEPPMPIYMEGLTRTNATRGLITMPFTPLMGMTDVVGLFYPEPTTEDRITVQMDIMDSEHISKDEREKIIASYPEHEREARVYGRPMLGSGRVFPIAEEVIKCDAFEIPEHWPRIVGLDFGWDHPTAAAWLAHDRDTDTIYLYDTYKRREATPDIHSLAIKAKGDFPVAWPHDGLQHDKTSGETLKDIYLGHGVNMLEDKAQFEDGGNSLEAGIMMMLERMQTGRFKVFSHLNDFWEEIRQYHRQNGVIVKVKDDCISAARYGMMMIRFAEFERSKFDYRSFYGKR